MKGGNRHFVSIIVVILVLMLPIIIVTEKTLNPLLNANNPAFQGQSKVQSLSLSYGQENYVDNFNSNVDGSADKGTHSNFPNQQSGPDGTVDILTEEDTGGNNGFIDLYVDSFDWQQIDWMTNGSSPFLDAQDMTNLVYAIDGGTGSNHGDMMGSFGFTDTNQRGSIISVTLRVFGRANPTKPGNSYFSVLLYDGTWLQVMDFKGQGTVAWKQVDVSSQLNTWAKINEAQIALRTEDPNAFHNGGQLCDAAVLRVSYHLPNYELDLEEQWTSVDYSEEIEELCIYTGEFNTSENLNVYEWDTSGNQWHSLGNLAENKWNNFTISITSSTYTIKFQAGAESNDYECSAWEIDATLIVTYTPATTTTTTPPVTTTTTTTTPSDTTPPIISNVTASPDVQSATITWNTDEPSDSIVNYGKTQSLGHTESDKTLVTSHIVVLIGLDSNTTYYYEVESKDAAGNTATDGIYSFTTLSEPDSTPPEIKNVQTNNILDTSATITWETDEPSDSVVNYGTFIPPNSTKSDTTMVIYHSVPLTGLTPATTYRYEVASTDTAGNTRVDNDGGFYYQFTTAPPLDTTPPVIQNVEALPEVDGATIVWLTDEPSTSKVEYGGTGPPFSMSVEDGVLTTSHSLYIPDLEPETTYKYRVLSADEWGNTAIYPETGAVNFTTEAPSGTTLKFTSNDRSTETGSIEIDRIYTTKVKYVDIEGGGNPIDGAQIDIIDSEGAVSKEIQAEGAGVYRIKLTPKPEKIGHFILQIQASKAGFNSALATLVLDIVPIQTDLYFTSNYQDIELAPVQINETYTTLVQFNRTSTSPETPIDNATLNVVSSDPGVSNTVTPLGFGYYQITVSANESKQFSLVIEASKAQYETDSVTLVLVTGLIETRLRFLSNHKSTETGAVQVYDTYSTMVQLNATVVYPELPIDGGTIEVRSSSPNLSYTVIPVGNGTGIYQIEISSTLISQLNLDLEASVGPKYQNTSALLTLIVEPLPTKLRSTNPEIVDNRLSLVYTEPIELAVLYTNESDEGMHFEHFEWVAEGIEFLSWTEGEGVGEYLFSFKASVPGTYSLTLTLYKPYYANASLTTVIMAKPIPIVIKDPPVNVIGGTDSQQLMIELRNEVDDSPIIGATVTYSLVGDDLRGTMEDLGNGIYVADLSGEQLDIGNYTFQIVAEKANHASLVVEYTLIVQEPASFLHKYWKHLSIGGGLVIGSAASYILKERKKRRKLALLEARKWMTMEYITDIAHFLDLFVMTPSGIAFYSFAESLSQQGLDTTLYSSFIAALKTFAGKSLASDGTLSKEDHFRFGGTEIFLYSIQNLIFAYMFSAQTRDGDWKKVTHSVLEKCRELTTRIEFEFQDNIKEFETFYVTSAIPHSKISELVTEVLGLNLIFPHRIIDMGTHTNIGLHDESTIIQTIEQMSDDEEGEINLIRVLERLEGSGIPPDDIVFIFYQLREEGAIAPVSNLEQVEESQKAEDAEFAELMADERKKELVLSFEEHPHEERITLFALEEKRKFLDKLRSIADTSLVDDNDFDS
ncbi:MAG: fibronectin type III domain-containing protein [Candidatus Heimdallarchaeota archaeon]